MKCVRHVAWILLVCLMVTDTYGGAARQPSGTPFPDLGNAVIHREALPQPPAGKKNLMARPPWWMGR